MRKIGKIVVTEADLREQVRDLCKLFGWKMSFSWTSLHSPRGFPDLVLVHPGKKRIIFAELKSEKGKVTEEQQEWLDALRECGQEVYVWRPGNFENIARLLQIELGETLAGRDRETGEIKVERQVDFRYCSHCRRYSSMVKLNNKWMCSECGYQEEIKRLGVNNEPNR